MPSRVTAADLVGSWTRRCLARCSGWRGIPPDKDEGDLELARRILTAGLTELEQSADAATVRLVR